MREGLFRRPFPKGLLVTALASSTWCALAPAADLKEAERLLRERKEGDVRSGAQLCLEADDSHGAVLLLRVLDRTVEEKERLYPAHYRDIVWEALEQLTGAEARAQVEKELKENSSNALVRRGCAELLGIYGDETFGKTLIAALSDKDEGVVRWAARSLGQLRHKPAGKALEPLLKSKNRYIRANAIEALARIDTEKHGPGFLQAVSKDADGGVRCALLGAAPDIFPDRIEALSTAALKDKDWRPRLQAVEHLAGMQSKGAVAALIEAAADKRGSVSAKAIRGLHGITGKKFGVAAEWKRGWGEEGDGFQLPEEKEERGEWRGRTSVVYHGINLTSDHAGFLIDRSKSMGERLSSKGTSKREAALGELEQVLKNANTSLYFNVFCYAEDIQSLAKQPLQLGASARKKALAFVRNAEEGSRKNIWNLLSTVVEDADLDTAYMLSSGEPDIGTYVHWNRVTAQLKDLNRFHKVVIHTIAYSSSEWYRSQLEKIAEVTGGEFKWFE